MFANAAGEHQRVEPAQHRGQGPDFLDGTPYKQRDGLRGPLGMAGQQRAHVTRHTARDAKQSGLEPELGLVPAHGTFDRYRLQEWLSFLSSEIHKGYIPLLYATLAGQYVETAKPKLEKRFAWIDEQLSTRPYLMGDAFTVADAYLFALTGWGQASWLTSYYKADIHVDHLHNLHAWYDRVKVRPAVQKALREEGLA